MNKPEPSAAPATRETPLTRPDYIGQSVRRPNARRLLQGRATYLDDILVPRTAHAVYLRSPMAHARIVSVDIEQARRMPGVVGIVNGRQMAELCTPWVGTMSTLPGSKSPPQYPMALDIARWQGEPVLAVVAESRRQAEDALQAIHIEWEELPAVTDKHMALAPDAPILHPELGDNLCFERVIDKGDVDAAMADAAVVVRRTFEFGRHTGMPMETRSMLADYQPAEHRLTVYQSHQAPNNMQELYARHFGFDENAVQVICKDIGGAFGIKLHSYPDDFATVALSIILKRPVKYVADRLESFVSDIHAREHWVDAAMALDAQGRILAIEIDDLTGIGPYSVYPRTSTTEGNQVITVLGGPYTHQAYRARLRVVFQNKVPTSQYRGTGLPVACAVAEGLIEEGARKLGLDVLDIRRRNVIPDDAYPYEGIAGIRMDGLSHEKCLDRLEALMDYAALRREQAELRKRGIYRGIGLAMLIEMTNPGAALFFGRAGVRVTGQDVATVRLDSTGTVTCMVGIGDQGQGTETIYAQIVADAVGAPMETVRIVTGDTASAPYGAGAWASRGAGLGGEAVLRAGLALRQNILGLAAELLGRDARDLDVRHGGILDAHTGEKLTDLAHLAQTAYFRPDTLPSRTLPQLTVTREYAQDQFPFLFTNGVQASYVEVDTQTGLVTLLGHWAVGDCGRLLNPMLVNEQMRGGIVQGIGGVLFEECLYDEKGLLKNGSFADYLVPMASEMPDIVVDHIETPTPTTLLGAKGTGEAGTAGAPGAVMNAINDALAPLGACLSSQPVTPEKILKALGYI